MLAQQHEGCLIRCILSNDSDFANVFGKVLTPHTEENEKESKLRGILVLDFICSPSNLMVHCFTDRSRGLSSPRCYND